MVESLMAVFLTVIAIVSLMMMQPIGWQATAKADHIGVATQIMQQELESIEYQVMRGTSPLPANKNNVAVGSFFLSSTITDKGLNKYLVHVQVKWKGSPGGVKSSMIVTRQMGFNADDHF